MSKSDDFKIGDKVKFKQDVKLYPTVFSKTPVYFAKKGDKGTVVKSDPKVVKRHREVTRMVAVEVPKHKTALHLMDSKLAKLMYVYKHIERA